MRSLTNTLAGVSDTTVFPQQAGLTGSLPFDGAESPTLFANGSFGGPAGLQHTPIEDGAVVEDRPKQETERKHGLSKSPISRPRHTAQNRVAKKYRQTLKAKIDQLRVHVPTLLQHDGHTVSRVVVLATAVNYIKKLEAEVKKLNAENARLAKKGKKGKKGRKEKGA